MKILCIEDNEENLFTVERLAELRAHELTTAMTAADGLRLAHQAPDLILMDISLPDMDGLTLTRQIRAFLPNTPIIAITAHAQPDYQETCLAAGCTEYMTKPYSIYALLDRFDHYAARLRGKNG